MINSTRIENVAEFVYLGSLLTWDNDCSKEIKRRIARATGVMADSRKYVIACTSAYKRNSVLYGHA